MPGWHGQGWPGSAAEDKAEDDDPLGHVALPPHPEKKTEHHPVDQVAGLERLDDAGPGPLELGVDPQRLAEMLECPLMVAPMEQGPTLVGVREGVFGVVGQCRAEGLLRPRPCGRAGRVPWPEGSCSTLCSGSRASPRSAASSAASQRRRPISMLASRPR